MRRTAVLIAAAGLVLVGWGATHAGTALVVSGSIPSPDAIVALASHEWERLPLVAELARRYPSSVVILTLPPRVTRFSCHECAHRVKWLERAGVPPSRIRVLPIPISATYGEAVACVRYAQGASIQRLLIVTSPYHTRRALAIFRNVSAGSGIQVGIQPARAYSPADPARWWRHPYDRWYVTYEWAATLYYSLRYGVAPAGA